MASIAFFTNAGISAFNTAQSTNEQVLIEQIRIASESNADETTTVLTALYECDIQDIIKSVDGMSFTIKSIIAKNTFTSTEILPVRVIGYYGRISNGGAKTLLAIAVVDPIVNSDGTKSFVINSTFSLTPIAATTVRLTVSPYLSYVTVNDLASYTTITAFETRKTVVDNELDDRFTKDEVNTKLTEYVSKTEIGNYTNSRQNIVSVKYGEDLSSGDMIKIVPEFNSVTNTHEPKAYKFNDIVTNNYISWMPDQQPYTYQTGFWSGGTPNVPYSSLYFSGGLSDYAYDATNKLYYVLRINDHRFAEYAYQDHGTPNTIPVEIYVDVYTLSVIDSKSIFVPKVHFQIGSFDRSIVSTGITIDTGIYREYVKNLKIVKIDDNGRIACFYDTISAAAQTRLFTNFIYLKYDIADNAMTVMNFGSVALNTLTTEFRSINNGANYTYVPDMNCIVASRAKTSVTSPGNLASHYLCDSFIYTYTFSGNLMVNHYATGVVLSNILLTRGTYMSGGNIIYSGVMNDASLYYMSAGSVQAFSTPLSDRYPSLKVQLYNNCICDVKIDSNGNVTHCSKIFGDISYNISELNINVIGGYEFMVSYIDNGTNIKINKCSFDNNTNMMSVNITFILDFPHRFVKTTNPPHKWLMSTLTYTPQTPSSGLGTVKTLKFSKYFRTPYVFYIINGGEIDFYANRSLVADMTNNIVSANSNIFESHKRLFKLVKNTTVADADYYHFDIPAITLTPYVLDASMDNVARTDVLKFSKSVFDAANSDFHADGQVWYCLSDALDPTIDTLPMEWSFIRHGMGSTAGNKATSLYYTSFEDQHMNEHNIDGTGRMMFSLQYGSLHAAELIKYEIVYDNDSINVRELISFENVNEQAMTDDDSYDIETNKETVITSANTYYDARFYPMMDYEHIENYPYILPKKMIFDRIDGVDTIVFYARLLDFFNGTNSKLSFRKAFGDTLSSPEIYTGYSLGAVSVSDMDSNHKCIGTAIDTNTANNTGNVSLFDNIIELNSTVNIAGDSYDISSNGKMIRNNITNFSDVFYKHLGGIKFMRSYHRYKKTKAHIRRSHLRNLLA